MDGKSEIRGLLDRIGEPEAGFPEYWERWALANMGEASHFLIQEKTVIGYIEELIGLMFPRLSYLDQKAQAGKIYRAILHTEDRVEALEKIWRKYESQKKK